MTVKELKQVLNGLPDSMTVRVCRPKTERSWTSYWVDGAVEKGGDLKLWIECSSAKGRELVNNYLKGACYDY